MSTKLLIKEIITALYNLLQVGVNQFELQINNRFIANYKKSNLY